MFNAKLSLSHLLARRFKKEINKIINYIIVSISSIIITVLYIVFESLSDKWEYTLIRHLPTVI